jgi:DNA-binding PadR family transcriptional regulator
MNDLVLLAALLPGPQHGYALKKQVGLISGKPQMHNNLVYPLLRRFVESGWVSKRQAQGQRGQTRELYSLTAKGRQELLRRLGEFTEKQAGSPAEFHLRVGLFPVLDANTRKRVLSSRDAWLDVREQRLARIEASLETNSWGAEVVHFIRDQIGAERTWIVSLDRKATREAKSR